MSTVQISLPDVLRSAAEQRAERAGFSSLNDYVVTLIEEDQRCPDDATVERILLERIRSGPSIPMDDAYFDSIRARVEEQIATRRRK